MRSKRVTLKEGIDFHGHLGPYLVLGILCGEFAIKTLGLKKYFGLEVKVSGACKKPQSCLIDGLQLSTGATYGKGNIRKLKGDTIKVTFYNRFHQKRITLSFRKRLMQRLEEAKTHRDSELLARKLYGEDYSRLFKLTTHDSPLTTHD